MCVFKCVYLCLSLSVCVCFFQVCVCVFKCVCVCKHVCVFFCLSHLAEDVELLPGDVPDDANGQARALRKAVVLSHKQIDTHTETATDTQTDTHHRKGKGNEMRGKEKGGCIIRPEAMPCDAIGRDVIYPHTHINTHTLTQTHTHT